MRRRDYYWSLYHTNEKNQLNDLRTDQIEAVFAAIPKTQRAEWLIWREGFRDWKPFEEFPQLLMSLRQVKDQVEHPKPPQGDKTKLKVSVFDSEGGEENEISLRLEAIGSAEDRNNARYAKSFDVRIFVGDRPHPNTTVNISNSGMELAQPLPQGLSRYFNVEIRSGKTVISLVCSEVVNKDGSPSKRLKIEVNDYPSALNTLLLAG